VITDYRPKLQLLCLAGNREGFLASKRRVAGKIHVLIIATGSVASVKIPLMVEALSEVCVVQCQTRKRVRGLISDYRT
jgi:siroheme synthase (precorrin-2 oxidase/ferrochelatase)